MLLVGLAARWPALVARETREAAVAAAGHALALFLLPDSPLAFADFGLDQLSAVDRALHDPRHPLVSPPFYQ